MLDQIDVAKKIKKDDYEKIITGLEYRLGELQREAKSLNIPAIIVFEGWHAAGKGTLINKLLLALDPRGFDLHPTDPPNEEEKLKSFLWRFWIKTPERGRITIFERSWYRRLLIDRMEKTINKDALHVALEEVASFERQLVDDGNVLIKFFFHITKEEQRKRFKSLEKDPSTAWRVAKNDWKNLKRYDVFLPTIDEMLVRTDTDFAPWTVVESHDWRYAAIKVFSKIIETLENKIQSMKKPIQKKITNAKKKSIIQNMSSSLLDKVDMSLTLTQEEYVGLLKKYQSQIRELGYKIFLKRIPVIIAYEGWDAAGKGGNIRRLVQSIDPRGYKVIPIAAPNDIEKAHHYLWRFWNHMPKAGHIAIFDRTWYGRVLVERVESFCSEEQWKRAYREINEMERHLVNYGTVLIKFWLHIDKDEELKRFEERMQNPHKKWKITDEDWRNRKKWSHYKDAVDEMLNRTSTPEAPWTIIESNSKWWARIKTLKTVVEKIEERL